MIWTIARKQLLANILTYRFAVGFVLCVLLFPLSAAILTQDYAERLAGFNTAVSEHTARLLRSRVFSQLSLTIDRRPALLSPVCEGFDKRFAASAEVSYTEIPTASTGSSEKNPFMAALKSIDLAAIVQVVLGLLALLFAFDAVSGERERGTLALSLANPVPRHALLLGNYLGGLLTLAPLLFIGIGSAALVMSFSRAVAFQAGDGLALGLLVLISLLYLSALYVVGLLVSTLTRSSSTSLVIILFLWVAFIPLLPNICAHLAYNLRPMDAKSTVDAQARNLVGELWRRIEVYAGQHPRPTHRWEFIKGRSVYSGDVPYPIMIYYAPREVMEWELEGLKYCLRLDMECAERVYALYRNYERTASGQAALARNLARLSPAWVYYQAAAALAGTDSESLLKFLEHARQYRRQMIEYVQHREALFSARYFTRMDIEKLPTTADLDAIKASRGQAAVDQMIGFRGWNAVPPLDLRDMPNWESSSEPVLERVLDALGDAGILVFLNLIFFLLAHVAFLRTDVRAN